MKVLFVTTKSPLPINDGHSLRSFNLLKAATQRHEVTLLSYVKFLDEYKHQGELQKICASVKLFPVPDNCSGIRAALAACFNLAAKEPYVAKKYNQAPMRQEILRLLRQESFDLVHLDMLPLGIFLDDIHVPVILNEHNVESALLKRRSESQSSPVGKWYFDLQQRRLEHFEADVVGRVSHVVACSEEDRALLKSMVPRQRITVVPNGVDADFYQSGQGDAEQSLNLVFVGGMNWFPNRDALNWFIGSILPRLLEAEPGVRLDVVGKPAAGMSEPQIGQVVMHGFVDDTRPFLNRAAVVVVPIRVGGGTRLKVLEAMSMGKAVVSTAVGVEGIEVEHRKHLLIADTPEKFRAAVLELLHNPGLRQELGTAARRLVSEKYQWEKIGLRLMEAYSHAVGQFHV